jgi:hypothetical protein
MKICAPRIFSPSRTSSKFSVNLIRGPERLSMMIWSLRVDTTEHKASTCRLESHSEEETTTWKELQFVMEEMVYSESLLTRL